MAATDAGDWRLQGQEKYLQGATLRWRLYAPGGQQSDHDHCEFCWAKFSLHPDIADALREGYATLDGYRWICSDCYNDFQEHFSWRVT